jgi:hypothetical protein
MKYNFDILNLECWFIKYLRMLLQINGTRNIFIKIIFLRNFKCKLIIYIFRDNAMQIFPPSCPRGYSSGETLESLTRTSHFGARPQNY